MSNILYDISNHILYDFLNIYCIKQYEFNNNIIEFYNILKNHYYSNKTIYLEREINYKNFITVIRQICKKNNISYIKKIKYDKSNYNIVYYIQIID